MKYMLNIFQILLLLYAFVDSFVHHDSNKLALKEGNAKKRDEVLEIIIKNQNDGDEKAERRNSRIEKKKVQIKEDIISKLRTILNEVKKMKRHQLMQTIINQQKAILRSTGEIVPEPTDDDDGNTQNDRASKKSESIPITDRLGLPFNNFQPAVSQMKEPLQPPRVMEYKKGRGDEERSMNLSTKSPIARNTVPTLTMNSKGTLTTKRSSLERFPTRTSPPKNNISKSKPPLGATTSNVFHLNLTDEHMENNDVQQNKLNGVGSTNSSTSAVQSKRTNDSLVELPPLYNNTANDTITNDVDVKQDSSGMITTVKLLDTPEGKSSENRVGENNATDRTKNFTNKTVSLSIQEQNQNRKNPDDVSGLMSPTRNSSCDTKHWNSTECKVLQNINNYLSLQRIFLELKKSDESDKSKKSVKHRIKNTNNESSSVDGIFNRLGLVSKKGNIKNTSLSASLDELIKDVSHSIQEVNDTISKSLLIKQQQYEPLPDLSIGDPEQKSVNDPVHDPVKDPVLPVSHPIDDPVHDSVQKTLDEEAQDPINEAVHHPVDQSVHPQPVNQLMHDPDNEPEEQSGHKLVQDHMNESVQNPTNTSAHQLVNETEQQLHPDLSQLPDSGDKKRKVNDDNLPTAAVDSLPYYGTDTNYFSTHQIKSSNSSKHAKDFCAGKRSGSYANRLDCSRYWICTGGKKHAARCPEGLVFNYRTNSCDDPFNLPKTDNGIPYYAACSYRRTNVLQLKRTRHGKKFHRTRKRLLISAG